MKKKHITILQRSIAYILFTSQILTSCVKPVLNPHPEALCPITHHQETQDNPQQGVMAARTHQTEATRTDSGKLNRNLAPTTIANPPKKPHQPSATQLSIESKKAERLICLNASTRSTVQVQQEVHERIEKMLAEHPVCKKHFLAALQVNKTFQLNTMPQDPMAITRAYHPARIQTPLKPLSFAFTLPIKDGLSISFVQDMNYWWGVVQETYPGFSRSTALPILYQQSLEINTRNANLVQPTVEVLAELPVAVQQQLVHIFSSNKTLRDAFIYIGEQIGLRGGGWGQFWGGLGLFLGGVVCAVVAGVLNTPVGGFIGFIGVLSIIEGIGLMGSAFNDDDKITKDPHAETKNRVEQEQNAAESTCKNAVEGAKNYVDKIKQDPKMYKDRGRMQDIFNQLNSARNTVNSQIKHLEQVKKNLEDKYDDFEVSGLDSSISDRKKDRDQVDNHIQEAKNEFKRQAQEARGKSEKKTYDTQVHLHEEIKGAAYNKKLHEKLNEVKKKISAENIQVQANINQYKSWKSMYESWQGEFSIDTSLEIKQINEYLEMEKDRQKHLQKEYELTTYMSREVNMAYVQQLNESYQNENADNVKKRNETLMSGVEQGDDQLLFYAFSHTQTSPNDVVDKKKNTLLHLAVITNQVKVVKLCLECGADKLVKNRNGKTPVDLAANKPEIKKLLEEKK